MSRCGIVATQRGKQTSGTSLEAECDRASVGKQPGVLFQAGMMSSQRDRHRVVEAHVDEYGPQLLMHKSDDQERWSFLFLFLSWVYVRK